MLLGCYRTGDANDPETYVAAIAASLARFPEEIITEVTHPVDGLPARLSWLPTVKDIRDACDAAMEPTRRRALADRQIKEQLADRAEPDRTNRPTSDDMKAKYGANWGLSSLEPKRTEADFKAPSWQAIASMYSADPSRIHRLRKSELFPEETQD